MGTGLHCGVRQTLVPPSCASSRSPRSPPGSRHARPNIVAGQRPSGSAPSGSSAPGTPGTGLALSPSRMDPTTLEADRENDRSTEGGGVGETAARFGSHICSLLNRIAQSSRQGRDAAPALRRSATSGSSCPRAPRPNEATVASGPVQPRAGAGAEALVRGVSSSLPGDDSPSGGRSPQQPIGRVETTKSSK